MFGISWDQISGLVQRVLMFGGGIAVGKGWISEQLMVQIVGALVGVFGVLWGVKVNTQASLVESVDTIAKQPGSPVKQVLMENTVDGRAIAASLPGTTTVVAGSPSALKA